MKKLQKKFIRRKVKIESLLHAPQTNRKGPPAVEEPFEWNAQEAFLEQLTTVYINMRKPTGSKSKGSQ